MQLFTGFEYLLIDAANNFGLDKLLFEERIQWGRDNLNQLEALTQQAETQALYIKAVMAIRKAQQGLPTGHIVAMDACCSGVQLMSVLTGCIAGATATGLVDPNRRADAYSDLNTTMQAILGPAFSVKRSDSKRALMTSCYGSKRVPKLVFGEDTPELAAFYEAVETVAPGAWELLQDLMDSWQPGALIHAWKLPDGFDARIKVMTQKEARIEVDELGGASFTYVWYENEGQDKGRSNVANVIHSIDAFVLREMIRRCSYDALHIAQVDRLIEAELLERSMVPTGVNPPAEGKHQYYLQQWARSAMPSAVILPYITGENIHEFETLHLKQLKRITNGMLSHKPFPLITIHDSFGAHANNCNQVRYWYKEILAELADAEVLTDIMNQLHGDPSGHYPKRSQDLSQYIRNSSYALS